jgi:hypothetical protein
LQLRPAGPKFTDHPIQGVQVSADLAVKPHLGAGTGLGNGYINGHFMDIQPHIQYTLSHGLPPWLWLCAVGPYGSQLNPRLQGSQAFNF